MAELFGVPPATVRVALTRAVASGELVREEAEYQLGERLLARQRRQDQAVQPATVDWDGDWEMAVVVVTGRSGSDRAALRDVLAEHRLSELREGVWMRPANLDRPRRYRTESVLHAFRARPELDPGELAARLWDLPQWASRGSVLVEQMSTATEPVDKFVTVADIVRHLTDDPILPAELLPARWPGPALRQAYADFQNELRALALF